MRADEIIPRVKGASVPANVTSESGNYGSYTSRPTNTSLLCCIKAVPAGVNYSTEEQEIGTWIDGKPLYQKTIMGTVGRNIPLSTVSSDIDSPVALQFRAGWYYEGRNGYVFDSYYQNNDNSLRCMIDSDHILAAGGSLTDGREIIITIQYTKTTD